MKKRILAALLSVVMVFTMIPFMGVTAYAENTKGPGDEYVSPAHHHPRLCRGRHAV